MFLFFPDDRLAHFVLIIQHIRSLKEWNVLWSLERDALVLLSYKYLSELLLLKFTLSRRERDKDYYQVISIGTDCYTAV